MLRRVRHPALVRGQRDRRARGQEDHRLRARRFGPAAAGLPGLHWRHHEGCRGAQDAAGGSFATVFDRGAKLTLDSRARRSTPSWSSAA
jgi:hypothetical protein